MEGNTIEFIITTVLAVLCGIIAGIHRAYLGILVSGFATSYLNDEKNLIGVFKYAMMD